MIGSSQNAVFEAGAAAAVAAAVARALGARAEGWRAGWRVVCVVGEHELEVTIGDGVLQIAPTGAPAFGERLRAARHPAAAACYRVATVVHVVLAEARCLGVRWRWDGPPRDEDTPYPRALSSIQATIAT